METEQFTEQQLIDFAEEHGYKGITHWKLERWHKQDVIPRPVVEHLGYGKGTRSVYPAQTLAQVLAVCRLLKSTRNFDVVRFQLWREGYCIPFPILKDTIRQLVPPLRWKVPRREEKRYDAVERRLNTLLEKMSGRFSRLLLKRFGRNTENLQAFLEIHLNLLYGIRVAFDEPSHYEGEPSATDIFAQGLHLKELWFLPKDLAADFQHFSDKGLLSITKMNAALDEATEEDLRRASTRSEALALVFEWVELMGFSPKLLQSFPLDISNPSFQALVLVFLFHLEKHGYADNMDGLAEVFRIQVLQLRAFKVFHLTLQQELPAVAKEVSTPQEIWAQVKKVWGQIKDLSESEREQYFARKNEHLREVYLHNQAELDAFWQRHPEIKNALEGGDPSSP